MFHVRYLLLSLSLSLSPLSLSRSSYLHCPQWHISDGTKCNKCQHTLLKSIRRYKPNIEAKSDLKIRLGKEFVQFLTGTPCSFPTPAQAAIPYPDRFTK